MFITYFFRNEVTWKCDICYRKDNMWGNMSPLQQAGMVVRYQELSESPLRRGPSATSRWPEVRREFSILGLRRLRIFGRLKSDLTTSRWYPGGFRTKNHSHSLPNVMIYMKVRVMKHLIKKEYQGEGILAEDYALHNNHYLPFTKLE